MTKNDKKQKLIGTEYRYYGTTLQKMLFQYKIRNKQGCLKDIHKDRN